MKFGFKALHRQTARQGVDAPKSKVAMCVHPRRIKRKPPALTRKLPDYVVQLPERGGRGVLAGGGIVTAAHCVRLDVGGGMVLGDYYIEEIQAGNTRLKVRPLAVEPVSDIALLGALDDQQFPDEVEAFEQFCETTSPVPLLTGRIKTRKPMLVRILGHDGNWIDGQVGLFNEAASSVWVEAEKEVSGGSSGGPILTLGGELVAIVSNASIPQGDAKATGCCPRPLFALPVWACIKHFGAAIELCRVSNHR
jgi:hypothetical protein